MIKQVSKENTTWNDLPWKFEAGTSNIADVIAYGAALDYLDRIGMDKVRQHDTETSKIVLEELSKLPYVEIYGPKDPERRSPTISFNISKVHSHDVASILDQEGIAIRSGHHCAQVLMGRLGVASTARASFYLYNWTDDVDALVEALKKVHRIFN